MKENKISKIIYQNQSLNGKLEEDEIVYSISICDIQYIAD